MLVDAHVHVACPDIDQYPRYPRQLGSRWWKNGSDVGELNRTLGLAGVDRAVVVQPFALYGTDCQCAADVVAQMRPRFALVGAIDMNTKDPAVRMPELVSVGASGVRVSSYSGDDTKWLTDGRGAAVWSAAADAGLVVVVLMHHAELGLLADLCKQVPQARIAIDHSAHVERGGSNALQQLLLLSDVPTIYLKVTSANLMDVQQPQNWLDCVIGAFGADRVCWGSDYPQSQGLTYSGMCQLAESAARGLNRMQREAFFASTSLDLWWP
jgi:L-fuconolactonase